MNFKYRKTSDSLGTILTLTDKIKLKRSDKYVALWQLSIFNIHGKIYKSHTKKKKKKKKNLKYQLWHGMKSFNYCMKINYSVWNNSRLIWIYL